MDEFTSNMDMIRELSRANESGTANKKTEEKIPRTKKAKAMSRVGIKSITVESQDDDNEEAREAYLSKVRSSIGSYGQIQLSEEESNRINQSMGRMTTGINSAIPMMCSGPKCSFASTCPYQKIDKAPILDPCVVEVQLISYWTEQFITEFDVNMKNYTELYLVSELAEFNIFEMRITKYLAENHPTLMQDVTVAIDSNGGEIVNKEVSRAFDLKERIKKSRMKVLESLNATRKERAKLNTAVIAKTTSTGQQISELKAKLESYIGDISKQKVQDANLE